MTIRVVAVNLVVACLWGVPARGDGGTMRLLERQGRYEIAVFSSPTPFRAGPVDLSVLVQDVDTGELVPEAQVYVTLAPRGRPGDALRSRATTEEATNKLLRAALLDLPEPGWWDVLVEVEGPSDSARVRFAIEAAEPALRWPALWPWLAWPALVILLFGFHQILVHRKLR